MNNKTLMIVLGLIAGICTQGDVNAMGRRERARYLKQKKSPVVVSQNDVDQDDADQTPTVVAPTPAPASQDAPRVVVVQTHRGPQAFVVPASEDDLEAEGETEIPAVEQIPGVVPVADTNQGQGDVLAVPANIAQIQQDLQEANAQEEDGDESDDEDVPAAPAIDEEL